MRLRYLHLPRCGPLVNMGIVFGQEEMLFGWRPDEPGKRKGAINFVVGVNGTGKSSLLRSIYQTFRSLQLNEIPAQPITLAWDRTRDTQRVTVLLQCPSEPDQPAWFAVLNPVSDSATDGDWLEQVGRQGKDGPFGAPIHYVGHGDPITTSLLQAHLPAKVVAYTSGSEILWENLEYPALHIDPEQEGEGSADDERPPGWTIEREWEEAQPTSIVQALTRFATKPSGAVMSAAEFLTSLKPDAAMRLAQELAPLLDIRSKLSTNQMLREKKNPDPSFRVKATDLRLAAIALSIWQAAKELKGKKTGAEREALRNLFLRQRAEAHPGEDARRVLNELDWFWPTHLSFTYRDVLDRLPKGRREQLLCLLGMADEATRQPGGRHRVVISLGPVESIDLETPIQEVMPYGIASETLRMTIDQVQGCVTGAEAVLRVFSSNRELDATLVEVFESLKSWQSCGLLEEITLTIKRLGRNTSADGEPDDVLVTFDQLSDGEQVLLGRVGLLFLLRRQDGALLLLDEPETHFNDVWKRQIIDLVDEAILKTTSAQVLVATHTSIALTDVFASEVVRLVRRNGRVEADSPAFPTFGADPGRILLHVFGSPDVIGSRAAEFLREKLKREWTQEERTVLEHLVNEIGSGWPRAKLAEILAKLDASSNS